MTSVFPPSLPLMLTWLDDSASTIAADTKHEEEEQKIKINTPSDEMQQSERARRDRNGENGFFRLMLAAAVAVAVVVGGCCHGHTNPVPHVRAVRVRKKSPGDGGLRQGLEWRGQTDSLRVATIIWPGGIWGGFSFSRLIRWRRPQLNSCWLSCRVCRQRWRWWRRRRGGRR